MLLKRFISNQSGISSIEYAFLAGLIALAIVIGLTQVGTSVSNSFTNANAGLK